MITELLNLKRSRVSLSDHAVQFGWGLLLIATYASWVYRSFDCTDADVSKAGWFELKLGPIGSLCDGANKYWAAVCRRKYEKFAITAR